MPGLIAELHKEYNGKVIPCMGTDGAVWLDRRYNTESRNREIREAAERNRHNIVGYQIGWLGHGGSWTPHGPLVML